MNNTDKKIKNLEDRIIAIEKRLSKVESFLAVENEPKIRKINSKTLSVKEFILDKKPKDDTQKIIAIAYFLEKYDGFTSFNTKDLAAGFERAKEKMPANINDRVNKIIGNSGYIMNAREKKDNFKAWTLTSRGERFVEENLPPKEKN